MGDEWEDLWAFVEVEVTTRLIGGEAASSSAGTERGAWFPVGIGGDPEGDDEASEVGLGVVDGLGASIPAVAE